MTVDAVRGAALTVRRGEVVGLVGASGRGKSTLARCVLQLERVDGGTVTLNGLQLDRLRGGALRRERRTPRSSFRTHAARLNPRRMARDIIREPLDYLASAVPRSASPASRLCSNALA